MTETKRKRGRPRKVIAPVEPISPDCEPATKGFVKKIMRLYDTNHKHRMPASVFGCVLGIATLLFTGMIMSASHTAELQALVPICILIALALAFVIVDRWADWTSKTEPATNPWNDYPEYIKKWTPPKADKECE